MVEPYNVILSFHQLAENVDACMFLDDAALCELNLTNPTCGDLNHLVSASISGRHDFHSFPWSAQRDLRKVAANLIAFPRWHLFMTGFAPLRFRGSERINVCYDEAIVTRYVPQAIPLSSSPKASLEFRT